MVFGESRDSNEDKHKAPTRLHIHPLSLQDGESLIAGVVEKIHQMGKRARTYVHIFKMSIRQVIVR